MTPEQEQKLDRILAQLDTNNKEGVAARLLASATRLENEHRRKLLNTLSDLSSKLDAYLAPWGTEWVDREGHKTTAGAPGAKLTTPAQRWWIETLRRLRGNWPPAPPPAG